MIMRTHVILMLALFVGTLGAQAPLTALWALDETTGTTAADGSINGNHGTLVNFAGTPWAPAVFGNGLTFDGIDDYVDCMPNGGLPVYGTGTPYSVTAWVNAPPQNDKRIYSEGNSTGAFGSGPLFTLGSGTSLQSNLRVYIRNDALSQQLTAQSVSPVFDGTWHHMAWVDDGAGAGRLYVDGVLDAADFSYTPGGTYPFDRVALGAVLRATTCCLMSGMLDDVRVYPFGLTATDVTLVMGNATLGTGFQVNQPGASLDVNGLSGSFASAGRITVAQGATFTLNLSTTLGGYPWELASANVPAIANGLVVGPANTVNVPLGHPSTTLTNGFFSTTWGAPLSLPGFPPTGYALSASTILTAPATSLLVTLQFGMMDPTAAGGFAVSGALEIDIP